jgi:protein-S-isoprenylcysteine O-methyltransferase Ste14
MLTDLNTAYDLIEFNRIYLAVFFSCVAAFYTYRIIWLKSKITAEVIFPGHRFGTTWWNHTLFRCFRVAIWGICVCRAIFPIIDSYLGRFTVLDKNCVLLTGTILLTVGFIFTISVHCYFGKEWRSGIDPNGPKYIISHGLYQYTRNPMFLGVAVSQVGFFMALPSIFTLLCLVIGWFTLIRQTLSEEQHLLAAFPEDYKQYTLNVRRWI